MIPDLPHADPEEWAALYAAGAMTAAEREAFDALLAEGCLDFDGELRRLDPVVVKLSQAVPPMEPRASTKAALLQRLAADQPQTSLPPVTPPPGFLFQFAAQAQWQPTKTPGIAIRILHIDQERQRVAACLRMDAGRHYPHHLHQGVEEVFVLDGDLRLGHIVMRAGDYQRAEGDTHHEEQYTENGCVVLIHMPLAALQK